MSEIPYVGVHIEPKYLYLIWDYEEHGPENIHATLTRSAVSQMLNDGWGKARHLAEMQESLATHLAQPDDLLCGKNAFGDPSSFSLCNGWGAPEFQVLRLYP